MFTLTRRGFVGTFLAALAWPSRQPAHDDIVSILDDFPLGDPNKEYLPGLPEVRGELAGWWNDDTLVIANNGPRPAYITSLQIRDGEIEIRGSESASQALTT